MSIFKKGLSTKQKLQLYRSVFKEGNGRQVMFDLMNLFHVLNEHDGGAYQEGQRSVVLHILRQSNVSVAALDEFLEEQEKQQEGEL